MESNMPFNKQIATLKFQIVPDNPDEIWVRLDNNAVLTVTFKKDDNGYRLFVLLVRNKHGEQLPPRVAHKFSTSKKALEDMALEYAYKLVFYVTFDAPEGAFDLFFKRMENK